MMDLSERDWHKSKRNRGVDPALGSEFSTTFEYFFKMYLFF